MDIGEEIELLIRLVGPAQAQGLSFIVDWRLVEIRQRGAAAIRGVADSDIAGVESIAQIVNPVHHPR